MAQDLIDKIRAAAQAKNVDPDVAVKIAQAESSLNPEAGAKTSSAKGLFQIVNKTWAGAGGKPGQQKNPDENIRVGTDLIASNTDFLRKNLGRDPRASEIYAAHFFGPTGASTLLAAAPDTPAASLFSPAVLKANPQLQGKTADQIRGMLQQKMGKTAAPTPAPAKPTGPTPAEQMMEPALRSGMTASAEDLGSGYKAALALSFLGADDANKPETDDDLQARLDREEEDAAAAEFAAYKPKNALADLQLSATSHLQQPVKMAAGGVPYTPSVGVKGTAREELDTIKSQYDKYNSAADAYNAALNKYKAEQYDPYIAAIAKYNAAAEEWNKGPRTTAFGMAAPTAPKEFTMTSPTAPAVSQADYEAKQAAAKQDMLHRQAAIDAASDPERYGLSINKFFADGGDVMSSNMPLNVNPMAGTPELMMMHGGVVHRADGSPMGGENVDHLTPQEIERMAEAQRPAFVTPGSGRGRQQGPISQALTSGTAYPAMARGVAELPYDIVGAPVDLATMAMRPFGYKEEKPVLGSDWIKEKMTSLGVRPGPESDPTLAGFRTAGELGANLVNPAAVARKAGPIVEQGAKALGKETARQMLRGMEGEGPLAKITPQTMMYAVKPRGGTFATSGDINTQPISKMDEMLEQYREALKSRLPQDQHNVVDTFVDKKVRKYFTNEFGTANDPLRTAMRTGEMPMYGRDVEEFPEYLLAAARDPNAPGHLQAKRHLEKAYDERTGLELKALNLTSPSDADARRRFSQGLEDFRQKERERMTAEGLPAEFQNPERPEAISLEDIQRYPNITRTVSGMIKAGEEGRLPSGQVWALQNQQPFYDISNPRMGFLDPRSVAETIQSLDPNKLKNMSFDQALIEGTKNMRVFREYDTAVDRASKGLSVPKEVLGMFTKPVLKSGDAEWVRLTEPAATKLEGKLLHHSVGGYADNPNYNLGGPEAFRSGKAQIFSLRQEKTGMPEVTIEAEKTDKGLKITQIKGDYNSFPSHRADDVFKFMDKHPNLVHINSEYYPRSSNGTELEQKIGVDWAKSYDHWKSGLPGEWIPTRQDSRRIDYVYGLPQEKAKGGMIERKNTDNRRYL